MTSHRYTLVLLSLTFFQLKISPCHLHSLEILRLCEQIWIFVHAGGKSGNIVVSASISSSQHGQQLQYNISQRFWLLLWSLYINGKGGGMVRVKLQKILLKYNSISFSDVNSSGRAGLPNHFLHQGITSVWAITARTELFYLLF